MASLTPTGADHLGTPYDDDQGHDIENGGFVTFPFSSNELRVSIGTKTAMACIDSGADLNVISATLLQSLPLHLRTKLRKQELLYVLIVSCTMPSRLSVTALTDSC